jgi:ABC-type branched-subunit amino acid transport system ATPase component
MVEKDSLEFLENMRSDSTGLNAEGESTDISSAGVSFPKKGVLEVKMISASFNHLEILKDLNLRIERGESIGIYGSNGSGKSTLLKIVSGFLKPSKGIILLNGSDITGLSVEKRVELGISFTFQIPRPFEELTVLENILIAKTRRLRDFKTALKKTEELLEVFEIDEIAERKAKNLSQGEKKLLEICRSVAVDPTYLLLDEPFASLDTENAKKIRGKIRMLKERGVSMIVTSHRSRILRGITDRIYHLEDGILKEV